MGNNGFAVVQSSTAYVLALRMQNNALVSLQIVPNPDIPPDWNILSFPINPRYTKQGTLDGLVGYLEDGRVCLDPDYRESVGYGEYSYYKPTEAYKLQQEFLRRQQKNKSYYEDFRTSYGSAIQSVAGCGRAASSMMVLGVGTGAAAALMPGGLATVGKTFKDSKIEEKYPKQDIVNTCTYVCLDCRWWLLCETTETSGVRTEVSSGSFGFSGSTSGDFQTEVEVLSVGFNIEFDAAVDGGMSGTKTRANDSESMIGLDISVNVPGDLSKYERSENGSYSTVYDDDGNATIVATV